MNYITAYLFRVLNHEKKGSSDYVIADYLIHHLSESSIITTDSLAEACHVSKASISRFCRNIGLNDFFELRYLLGSYYIETEKKFELKSQKEDFVTSYVSDVESKMPLLTNLDRQVLMQIVKDIKSYKNVVLMGHMQSANIAYTLQQDLSAFGKIVYCIEDFSEQRRLLVSKDTDTLIIAFSTSGRIFKRVLPRGLFEKRLNQPKIYLISTTATSKNEYAHVHINLDTEYSYISSNVLMLMYANLIALGYKEEKNSE